MSHVRISNGWNLRVASVGLSTELVRCIKPKRVLRLEPERIVEPHSAPSPRRVQRHAIVLGGGLPKTKTSRRQTQRPEKVLLPSQQCVGVDQNDKAQQPLGRPRSDLVEVPTAEGNCLRNVDRRHDVHDLVSLLDILRTPNSLETASAHEASCAWADRLAVFGDLPDVQEEEDGGLHHEIEPRWRLADIPEALQVKSTSADDAKRQVHEEIMVHERGATSAFIPSASALTEDLQSLLAQVGVPPLGVSEQTSHDAVSGTLTENNLDVQNNWIEIVADQEVESVFGQTLQRLISPTRRIRLATSRLDMRLPPPEGLLSRRSRLDISLTAPGSEAHGSHLSHSEKDAASALSAGPQSSRATNKSSLRLESGHKPFGGRLRKQANLSLPRVVGPKTFYNDTVDWTIPRTHRVSRRAAEPTLHAAELQAARLLAGPPESRFRDRLA